MKSLISAVILSLSIAAAQGQPQKAVGYSAPARLPAPVPGQQPEPQATPLPPPPTSGTLEKAKYYFDEKSWQLAVNMADEADTSTLSAAAARELAYIKARALNELHKPGEAFKILEKLIAENDDDEWAGRAHWRMQNGLDQGRWIDVNQQDPLQHLHAADRILRDLKPDDLDDFYMSVINSNLATLQFPQEKDRDYILSFFDKIVPLVSGNEELLAGVQLRRQAALSAQNPNRTQEEKLSGMRGIVSEFPRTRAAAQAQWDVASYYIQRKDFVPALYELTLLTNQFAGTEEADRAAKEIVTIKRGEAAFVLPEQFLPGEEITFELGSRNTSRVKFTAVPFDIIEELKRQKTTRLDLQAIKGDAEFAENIKTEQRDDYLPTTRTVTLDIDERGVYVLRAEVDGKVTCNAMLVISDLAMAGNISPNGYELWTVDAKDGKPRANSKITVAHNQQRDNHWATGKQIVYYGDYSDLESDSYGFADFTTSKSDEQMFAVAHSGRNVAFLGNIYWSSYIRHGANEPLAYVYTDRPVYRPEQKVYWRAIVRERVNGEFQLPGDNKYKVVINDPKHQEVYQQTGVVLSEFGTMNGEMTLAPGAPLGMYTITITDEGSSRRHVGNGNFRVEEYKKPEFEVTVESASDFARVGDEVKARVEAKYLFGSPVSDANVKYTVRRRPRYRIMWDNMSWHLDDRDLGWFEDEPERPHMLHGSGGTIVADGEGKLDANGEFTLTFDSTVPDDELKAAQPQPHPRFSSRMIWPPPQPSTWDFQVEVTVTDASRRNIDASQVIPVGLKALNLAAKTQRTIVTPGDNARVELKSMNLAEKPVPTSGTLFVEKLVWNDDAEEDDITTVSSQAVAVEASGSLVLNWRVPSDLHGRLRFAYIVDDPFGGKSVAYADFYAVSNDDTDVNVRYQGVEIVTDKTRYTVGETARVMILSEYKDAVAWYWIDSGSGNLHKQVLPLPHRTNFVTIPITEAFVPNSQVHIVAVRDKQIIVDEIELIVPPTSRVINVEVTPGQATVEPGQTGTVTVHATDEHGQPVSAELSLSIFDQAITYIAPDTRPDIRKIFYGMKRPLRSDIRASLNASAQYGGPTLQNIHRFLGDIISGIQPNYVQSRDAVKLRSLYKQESAGLPPPAMMASDATAGVPAMAAMPASEMAAGYAVDAMETKNLYFYGQESPQAAPVVRTDFRDSMFWSPTVRTDSNGSATVSIKYPDSLTTWRMVAVGLTPDTRVGNATTETVARKKVLVRLQTPRFFRERDQLTISANVHNYTDTELEMDTTLRVRGIELDGATTMPLNSDANFMGNTQKVTVPAGGEKRLDWNVKVTSADAGDAILNLMALSSGGSDAMQTTVPLLPHGIDKFVAWNGTSRDEVTTGSDTTIETSGSARVITRTISLPAQRIRETSRLEITVNPSLASSIRDAIPYMIDYPYGCVEQTLSRFVPAVVAARAFHVLGYPLDQSMQERLPKVTEDGLKRLRDMQLPTGGWGWWANDSENLYMTAYTMYGLTLARQAEVAVDNNLFDRGLRRLGQLRDEPTSKSMSETRASYWYTNNLHNLMFAEYVMTLNNQSSSRTVNLLWTRRDELSAHGLSMLARTMGKLGHQAEAEVVLRNMVNMAVAQPENNTLRWGRVDSGWRWHDEPVEATAVGLMAYLELKPDDPAVDQAMKWLVLNRQGRQWKSTRDTAQAVLALTQYMLQKKESAKPVNIAVRVGDKLVKTLDVTPQNFWDFDGHIILRGNEIPDGDFPVSFTVSGEGNIYYSIFAEYFTLEEDIEKAGNEIYVTRTYEILHREKTTETVNGKASPISKDTWLPLKDGDPIKSGDELRVNLKIKSLNDYQYLVFEDPKPAGMEPVDLQSGTSYGGGLCSNMELRDAWVAFFITHLRQGEHTLSYRVRAEIPGTFHTMPTTGYAMYFPPLRANADEAIMKVVD